MHTIYIYTNTLFRCAYASHMFVLAALRIYFFSQFAAEIPAVATSASRGKTKKPLGCKFVFKFDW